MLGHILRLPQGARAASDTNGHRKAHAGVQCADLIQHIVAAVGELLQLALLHHGDIAAAAAYPAQKAAAAPDHILQNTVDALQQTGALAVHQIPEHIIVAVQLEGKIPRTAGLILCLNAAQLGLLVQHQQGHAFGFAGHGGAVHAPVAVGKGQQLPLALAAQLQIQPGQQLLHPTGQHILPAQQAGAELAVVP